MVVGVTRPISWVIILWPKDHMRDFFRRTPKLDRNIVRGWDRNLTAQIGSIEQMLAASCSQSFSGFRGSLENQWETHRRQVFSFTKWLWLKVATMWCHSPSRTFLSGPWAPGSWSYLEEHVFFLQPWRSDFLADFWLEAPDVWDSKVVSFPIQDLSDMIHTMPRCCRGWARTCIHLGWYWKVLNVRPGKVPIIATGPCVVFCSFVPISHLILGFPLGNS